MPARTPLWVLVILLALLTTVNGCRSTAQEAAPSDDQPAAARAGEDTNRGMFLRTGAIQLGPGVGSNLWRWQGDGQNGF